MRAIYPFFKFWIITIIIPLTPLISEIEKQSLWKSWNKNKSCDHNKSESLPKCSWPNFLFRNTGTRSFFYIYIYKQGVYKLYKLQKLAGPLQCPWINSVHLGKISAFYFIFLKNNYKKKKNHDSWIKFRFLQSLFFFSHLSSKSPPYIPCRRPPSHSAAPPWPTPQPS